MAANRVFLPQEAVDAWLGTGDISLEDDLLTLSGGIQLRLTSALRFTAEVAEGSDPHGLVGKVKTLEEVTTLSGEHCADSVIIGDNAYDVIEGFVGEPVAQTLAAHAANQADPVVGWFTEHNT